ncbi:MAG: transglycosylase SLT domain-containing protein, partial [Gemmatimonadota bacterium]
ARRARVEAARQAGDLARARSLANDARGWARTDATRSEFLLLAGRLAMAMGDTAAARDAFRSVIDRNPGGAHSRRSAELLRAGQPTPEDYLALARVQAAQGLHEEALPHFREWLDADVGSARQRDEVRLDYATALFYAERYRQAVRALEPVADRTAARFLMARAEAHRGRTEESVRIYLRLARDRAGSATGSNALLLAAGTLHDAGEAERARELYRELVRAYPGSGTMGLAMMRLAGMAFEEGDYDRAARRWDEYRRRYPRGDRALQATYWAARARTEAGDSAGAVPLFRQVLERDRDSYYALLASRRLDQPFWPLPMEASPAASPEARRRVDGWMRELDLLRTAGFAEAADALADRLVDTVGGDPATRYALAEALADRGYSQGAIRIGITLQGSGPPNRRLLQILYPFPYRTLVSEESRDRGLDPFLTAALIRQESMFERRITSPAGARGLMQVMPATGRLLAEAAGIDRWDAELLYQPEINVHLGTRYVAQQMDEYDGSLPAVFSAYNAGPHRVERWSGFAEFGREELFTERIPFAETRGYVKILTRNRALYSGLYAGEADPGPRAAALPE